MMADDHVLGLKNGGEQKSVSGGDQEGVRCDVNVESEQSVIKWVEGGEEEEVDNDRVFLGLIGRLWTNRNPNPTAFISTMKTVWTVKHGVELVNIGRNLYQTQFFHWRDKKKILDGQPWHFEKYPLLLVEIDTAVKPSDLEIFYLPLWARFYDIPFKGRGNEANARMLGNKIGVYLEMAKSSGCNIEKSLRVRVKVDVRKPLRDQVQLKIRGEKMCDIPVKYERLPLVCFYCGRLGHGMNECVEVSGDRTPEQIFGPSLRASPWKPFTEDSAKPISTNGVGGSLKPLNRMFITKKLDDAKRLEGQKLVDEVADFFNKVLLIQEHDNGHDNARSSSLSSQDLGIVKGLGSKPDQGVLERDGSEQGIGGHSEDCSHGCEGNDEVAVKEGGGSNPGGALGEWVVMEHRILSRRWKRRACGDALSKGVEQYHADYVGKRKPGIELEAVIPVELDKNSQRRRIDCMEVEEGFS